MAYRRLIFDAFRRYINSKTGLQNTLKKYRFKLNNPRNLGFLGFFGLGFATSHIYLSNLETVPYTKRSHLMLLSRSREKRLGEAWFEAIKSEYKGKIVPPLNPNSIRLQKIGHNIVEAARKGIKKQARTAAMKLPHHQHDNVIERMKALLGKRGFSHQTANLEGFKWEFVLVDEPHIVHAFCAPAGKIFVFTGLLNMFRDDAEIAFIIGHEVGHGVARHTSETISTDPWLMMWVLIEEICKEQWLKFLMHFIRVWFFQPDLVVTKILNLFLRLPYSRRRELEADYIGLILMASAGYDPRIAPLVWKKVEEISESSLLGDFISTHPSCEKRAQLLSQPKVMEEALSIYRERRLPRFWLDKLMKMVKRSL